jgi:hypothetical protein
MEHSQGTHLIVVCTGLHGFVGHEFGYTKLVERSLPKGVCFEVWGRKDVTEGVSAEFEFKPVFSKINYTQEDSLHMKAWSLLKREAIWFFEFRRAVLRYRERSKHTHRTIFLLHTVSLYNTWLWLYFARNLKNDDTDLALLFRYSSVLLPKPLRRFFSWLVAKFPRASRRHIYLTDSHCLRDEYLSNTGLELAVLPVPVELPCPGFTRPARPEAGKRLRISYLGAARNDKGFAELPGIVETVLNSEFASKVEFCIQASTSGAGYLDNVCLQAMEKLKHIQSSEGGEVVFLLEKSLNESQYKALLTQADLIMLPYTGRSYRAQTSGILIEAAVYQVPCIVPKRTWLEDELAITGGGVAFDPDEPGSAGYAVLQVLRSYETYAERARLGAVIIAERHGHNAFARALTHNLLLVPS